MRADFGAGTHNVGNLAEGLLLEVRARLVLALGEVDGEEVVRYVLLVQDNLWHISDC